MSALQPPLEGLGLDQLPLEVAERGLTETLRYARGPERDGEGVRALLVAADDVSLRSVYACSVRRDPRGGRLFTACACTYRQPCSHTSRLLVDLALSVTLRNGVATQRGPVEPPRELAAQRALARAELGATLVVSRWLDAIEPLGAPIPPMDLLVEPVCLRGALELHFEGRAPGQRARLDLHDPAVRAAMTPEDRGLCSLLVAAKGARKARIEGAAAGVALELLRARGARDAKTGEPLRFSNERARPVLERAELARADVAFTVGEALRAHPTSAPDVRDETQVAALEVKWSIGASDRRTEGEEAAVTEGPFPWLWLGAERAFYPLDSQVDPVLARRLCARPSVEIPPQDDARVHALVRRAVAGRGAWMPVARSSDDEAGAGERSPAVRFSLRVEGRPLEVRAWLDALYREGSIAVSPEGAPNPRAEGAFAEPVRPALRERELELAALHRALRAGLTYDPRDGSLRAEDEDAARFWSEGLARLREPGEPVLELSVPETLARTRARVAAVLRVRIALVGGWLETSARLESEGAYATPASLREALTHKRKWIVLHDGTLARISETMARCARDALELAPDGAPAALPLHQLARVEQWAREGAEVTASEALEPLRERVRAGHSVGPARVPAGLTATLRPYQLQALAWLQSLDALRAGGVLADDMGLGKTVVSLAYLLERREREGRGPVLVLCPTSVAGHWIAESARFTPSLRVVRATERTVASLRELDEAPDVLVATYAWARFHVEALRETEFRCVFLDEAQRIKNPDAETTRAARTLRAQQVHALSGTPVENRLLELWSVMDLCVKGLLGPRRGFESRFEAAIRAEPDGAAARHLRALLRPFVLRRTKREVLPELPARAEVELACPPGPLQRALYNEAAAVLRERVRNEIARDGLGRSTLGVLTALLRLRQLACDPRLLDRTAPPHASAKRQVFLALVRDLVASGRRALVFSQFVELLKLWAQDLRDEGIAFEYLDGATTNRDAVVTRFREGTAPLFLLSLTAGGLGLNLTSADTVVLCDPWWNPAVETQAGDRAHRIGQTRAVTVYRLVARGTVEEKVLALQTQKRALIDAVVRADAGALRGLREDELRALLGGLDDDDSETGDEERELAPRPEPASAPTPCDPVEVRTSARAWLAEPGSTKRTLAARALVTAKELDAALAGRESHPEVLARVRAAVRDLRSERGSVRRATET